MCYTVTQLKKRWGLGVGGWGMETGLGAERSGFREFVSIRILAQSTVFMWVGEERLHEDNTRAVCQGRDTTMLM